MIKVRGRGRLKLRNVFTLLFMCPWRRCGQIRTWFWILSSSCGPRWKWSCRGICSRALRLHSAGRRSMNIVRYVFKKQADERPWNIIMFIYIINEHVFAVAVVSLHAVWCGFSLWPGNHRLHKLNRDGPHTGRAAWEGGWLPGSNTVSRWRISFYHLSLLLLQFHTSCIYI